MLKILYTLFILLILMGSYSTAHAERSLQSDMAKLFHEMRAGNQNRSINVDIGHGVILKGRVELTTKGNGGLSIANLDLRTYDTHNDGLVYKTKMLDTDLVDLSGNGYLDIVVSGIAVHTLTIPYKEEDIIFIYRYIPDKKIFEQIYRKSSFEIDVDKMP